MITSPVALRGFYYFTNVTSVYRSLFQTDGNTLRDHGTIFGALSSAAEYSDGIVFSDRLAVYTLSDAGQLTRFVDESTLIDNPGTPANVSSGIVFAVGSNLWRTDGTLENTVQLPISFGKVTREVSVVGSDKQRALIRVRNRLGRTSLWSSDGTTEGTNLLQPLGKSNVVTVVGNTNGHTLFVVKADPYVTTAQLWATDGTPQTTHRLGDLNPHPASSTASGQVVASNTFTHNGLTYFINTDPAHGAEIWRTNGTPQGTRLAYDLVPGPESGQPALAGIVGDRLVFNATIDGHLGMFAVDLKRRPIFTTVLTSPPQERVSSPFSNTSLSRDISDDLFGALDVLTASAA
jgi:ELWxxDGT repeat protein